MHPSRILKSFYSGLMGVFAALCVMIAPAGAGPLVAANGVAATPSVYKVTITKIEFFGGSWVTWFSGTCVMDIASVATGESPGSCGAGNPPIPAGTYTKMRITVSRTFTLKGEVADSNTGALNERCRTVTGGASANQGIYSNLNVGAAADAAAATEQALNIPTASDGSIAAAINAISGMSINSSSVIMTLDNIKFVESAGEATDPSGFSINFQVENKMEFLGTGAGACQVINLPPFITVNTNEGSFSFEPTL